MVVFTGGEPALELTAGLLAALRPAAAIWPWRPTAPCPTAGAGLGRGQPQGRNKAGRHLGPGAEAGLAQEALALEDFEALDFGCFFLQPRDDAGAGREANAALAVAACLARPLWRLSLQSHKYIGIP